MILHPIKSANGSAVELAIKPRPVRAEKWGANRATSQKSQANEDLTPKELKRGRYAALRGFEDVRRKYGVGDLKENDEPKPAEASGPPECEPAPDGPTAVIEPAES